MTQELTFRDGVRSVPDHVEDMLSGMETWKYTYRQAMDLANQRLIGDKLDRAQRDLVREHFKAGAP